MAPVVRFRETADLDMMEAAVAGLFCGIAAMG